MVKVIYNAKVYVEKGCYKEAILVEDGYIKAVGDNTEILQAADAACRASDSEKVLIDCKGRTVIPGLNDSHMHFMLLGETHNQAMIEGAKSIDEMVEICRKFAAEHPENVKEGLHAMGWNQDEFEGESRFPDRHDLDKISTEYPICLERICGHIVSVNSKLIEMLDMDSPEFKEGDFLLGEDGKPNGIFTENGCNIAKRIIPDFTLEQRKKIIKETMDYAASLGLTSVQSNDVGTTFMDGPAAFKLLREIYEKGEGKVRYRHQVCFNDLAAFEDYLENGEFAKGEYPKDSWLTLGPLKLFKDGSLGARTALLKGEYLGQPGNHGLEWISEPDMEKYCQLAKKHNLQVVTHVIGDEAAASTMRCYKNAFVDGKNKLRHALVHCQLTDEEILKDIKDSDILVMAQPIFINYDLHVVEKLVGKELASTSYAFGRMIRDGVHLSYGTDCPVEDCNPFPNIYTAVARKDLSGFPEEGFYPEERVDVETAIDAYTYESAYAEFMEDVKGRLKPGYYADLVVLDKDIFTCDTEEIKDIKPVLTMVGGQVVYEGK